MNGWQQLLSTVSLLLGGGGLVALVKTWVDRRKRAADVTSTLSDAALKWVEQFQEETSSARREAAEARREVAEVRRELGEVRREAEALARDLRNLRGAIMSPTATLDRLREMVGGNGLNGRG